MKTEISYFDREDLHEYVQESAKELVVLFHQDNNCSKASNYFYLSHLAKNKTLKRRL